MVVPAAREHHAELARFLEWLGTEDPVPDVERWCAEMAPATFFLSDGARFVGYAFHESYGGLGYVRHVVVADGERRRGVGSALMRELARRFRAAGASRWELNVKRDNAAAIALYERCGMRAMYETDVVRIGWDRVPRLAGSARSTVAARVEPADDRAVERAFRLPEGQVAHFRGSPRIHLAQLVDAGRPVAFARFDPAFPGCFPFRVAAPELARALLESLRPRARADDAWIQLVVEDDAATVAALVDAGASQKLAIVHMGGPIPSGF